MTGENFSSKKKKLSSYTIAKLHSIFAFWASYIFSLCPWKQRGGYSKYEGEPRPIILVHGYLNSSFVWFYHLSHLIKAGFGPIYTINLGNPFSSIEEYVEKLEKKVKNVLEETGAKSVVLIGHSMGGLVSSYFAVKKAKPGEVSDVISLGTPYHGTTKAYLGFGKCANQMRMGSSFIENLQKIVAKSRNVRFYQIATKGDHIVVPYTSALLSSHRENQYVLEDVGHAALLFSSQVNKKLIFWLEAIYKHIS
jgi:triacylglycerol lipase